MIQLTLGIEQMMRMSRLLAIGFMLICLVLLWPLWLWTVERVEVEPDTFLVITNRWGEQLPEGMLVAPDSGYKGIQREVLPEGRHFLNPLFYSHEKHKVLIVPGKHCAVLIRKAGSELSAERKAKGEYLASSPLDPEGVEQMGERGIVKDVLGPGKYRLNPYVYDVEIVPAVEIESQQVGVKILRWGDEPIEEGDSPYIVNDGERGVQRTIVPGGTHYINPYLIEIVPVDVRAHTVIFDDIEFPSKDGFTIEPRVQVRYKVIPEKAPELFVLLCEADELYQLDDTYEDQKKNPILQKIILPLVRGYVRIEGSKHDAREYISKPKGDPEMEDVMNPREKLQVELMEKVKPECAKVGITIEYIAVGQTEMNPLLEELAAEIREREQARIMRSTNEQKVVQFVQEQELKSTQSLAQQRSKTIDATTKLEQEKIRAEQRIQNEKAQLEAELEAAQARLDGAKERAKAIVTEGRAKAAVVEADNQARIAELKTAMAGFATPEHFAQYKLMLKVAPALAEIFTSDSSEFAKLFSTYMSPAVTQDAVVIPKIPAAEAIKTADEN